MTERLLASRHLGLDLGGTNIKWAVVEQDAGDWRTLDRAQEPTPTGDHPDAVIARLIAVGQAAMARCSGVTTAGLGIPGLYDPRTGATRFLVNIGGAWAGKLVGPTIGDALGVPTNLINDARAFGLAELRLGAGRGASTMVGLTLGTGIGGVIAVDGRVLQGHDGTGGELGHQTIEPDGPWCGCGNRGCLEAFVRADQIAAAGGTTTAMEVIARARAGDPRAGRAIADVGRYLGIGIANTVVALNPDRVVLGGGIAAAFDLLIDGISAELQRRVHVTSLDEVEVVPAELGTWAGAIGSAIHGAEQAAARSGAGTAR